MPDTHTNPYRPPDSFVHDPTPDPQGEPALASRWQRLGAALLDSIIGLAYGLPIMWALGVFDYIGRGQREPVSLAIGTGIVSFAMFVLVHGYFIRKTGQTLGKKLVGIRIAALDSHVAAFGKIVWVRYLPIWVVSMIPALGSILPLIDVLFIFRADRRCVHDLIAGTRVVKVSP